MEKNLFVDELTSLIHPIVDRLGYELYYLEYVKENRENYLRVYIDKDEGIALEDCEKVSREVSEMMDVEDPISEGYYLEISSPGIERELHNDNHLNKYIDYAVSVKLKSLFNGSKKIDGVLKGFDKDILNIQLEDNLLAIPREKIKTINLKVEF
ncbi:ribosome maturation factor RimP [uncultured Clostridium sp.]|uniref:ribosome maturation factor RimP n=1 Tax=uncultured Clostridium sp. TaxID=59620 RepID=UPI0028E85665|nr:ribosome maturation factor RimP [uncultured Clostridium sp.]